ncbi:MAG: hypothetical protein TEF_00040 [Rhizobiales bacterium NRL2]|jgi:hypothetical protein|nr:MAG: hypothetical protein TEF_00040 [Rhizobiales bacterium NRL2]
MTRTHDNDAGQLGFDALLADTDAQNANRKFERETAHLPGDMEKGLSFFRELLRAHHDAILACDGDEIVRIRGQARLLAAKLNGGTFGILAGPEASGNVLMDRTAAPQGHVPLWGQKGDFIIEIADIPVRVEMEGMLGIASHCHWLGFSIHAVDRDRPFLSETGYRSFLGVHVDPVNNVTVDQFVETVLRSYLSNELRGHPVILSQRGQRLNEQSETNG